MSETHEFGALVRQYRLAASLSQDVLGERAKLSGATVANLERGRSLSPRPRTVLLLAEALGLDTQERAALIDAATAASKSKGRGGAPVIAGQTRIRHNLPAPRTRLIGREADVRRVRELVLEPDRRLVTLAGTGGCGKTRLAMQVASELVSNFRDGVWLVNFEALTDPKLLPHTVAAALGCRERASEPLLRTLITYLSRRELLLVLDNCEHLLDACARLVDQVLDTCPGVRILATSRERLRIATETTWRVPSLAAPDPNAAVDPGELSQYPAVRLFLDRAQAVEPAFALRRADSKLLAGVCARVEGLPLAIELAAAQVQTLSLQQILERLDDSVRLLVGGSRTASTRQQTMRATIDWSFGLLSPAEQAVLRRLAVFAGGWSVEAAESVCADEALSAADVLGILRRLVDASLAVPSEPEGRSRFRLLEPIRQYAREHLASSNELPAVQRRHARFFLAFAERLHVDVRKGGPESLTAGRTLTSERDNLRTALRWCIDASEVDLAYRFTAASFQVPEGEPGPDEELGWLNLVLAMRGGNPESLARGVTLQRAGYVVRGRGDLDRARELNLAALPIARKHGDSWVAFNCLAVLGILELWRGRYTETEAYFHEALALARSAELPECEAVQLGNLGWLACARQHYDAAQEWCRLALAVARPRGDAWPIAVALIHLATALIQLGQLAAARSHLEEALVLRLQLGETAGTGRTLALLGRVAHAEGRVREARSLHADGLRLRRDAGDRIGVVESLEGIAELGAAAGHMERMVQLVGAASAERRRLRTPSSPMDRERLEQWLPRAAAVLGEDRLAQAQAVGEGTPIDEAYALALAETEAVARSSPGAAAHREVGPLTARQEEVAVFVAQGWTNRRIAERLVITERAAAAHIERILHRLDFTSRTQIGVWAAEHGLLTAVTS